MKRRYSARIAAFCYLSLGQKRLALAGNWLLCAPVGIIGVVKYVKSKTYLYIAALAAADAVFFGTTNPGNVASPLLVVGYLLAVMTIYWLVRLAIALLSLYLGAVKRHGKQLTKLITGVAALLLAMQSIGQLTVRDLAVLLPLALVGYFYISYGKKKAQP